MKPLAKYTIEEADKKRIQSLEAQGHLEKKWYDSFADFLTAQFGTVFFLILNALFFAVWIAMNTGFIPGIASFDPFPYGLLTMIVSLEAIFLSIIVLISQNRSAKIDQMREKLDLLINIHAEDEVTKILNIVDEIHDYIGLNPTDDPELKKMKKKLNIKEMEKEIADSTTDSIS